MSDSVENPTGDSVAGALIVIDSLFDSVGMPVTPQLPGRKNSAAYKYYRRIRPDLIVWWEEFSTAMENGTRKYPSVAQFIYSRTNKKDEQRWLMDMLGPAPEMNEKRDAPWLGDWYSRRLNGSWLPEQITKVKSLINSLKNEKNVLSSLMPISAQLISRNLRMHEQIDEAFAGQMYESGKNPTEAGNQARARMFIEMHRLVDVDLYRAMEEMMACAGMDRKNMASVSPILISNQVTQNQQLNQLNQETTTELPKKELELLKLARTLQHHSERLKLPLSDKLKPVEIKGEIKEKTQ